VRRAQARMSAEDAAIQAKAALARGDYDTAIAKYREALLILRYNPLIADNSFNERVVSAQLDSTVQQAEDAKKVNAEREREAAAQEAERREQEQREYRQQRLATLWDKANAAYRATRYGEAEQLANQILLEDPGNASAVELKNTAQAAKQARSTRRCSATTASSGS